MYSRSCFITFMLVAILLIAMTPAKSQAAPNATNFCGSLGEYTSWYNQKPTLWVWKNGKGKSNPSNVNVKYNGRSVPNSASGVSVSSPQVDNNDGWVGYYIAKRWYLSPENRDWDNDKLWDVTGCVQR
jgi:hypothetical protein